MSYKSEIARLLRQYGTPVEIVKTDPAKPTSCRAFIQPLRYKNKMYLGECAIEAGWFDNSHYLYIGPEEPPLTMYSTDTLLRAGGQSYLLKKAENVTLCGEVIYVWAVLQAAREESA